jgi:hypothetical protein
MTKILHATTAFLVAATMSMGSSNAAPVSFALSLEIVSTDAATAGYLGQVVTGSVGYDDAILSPEGDGFVGGPDLDLSLSLGGFTLTEENDADFPFFPSLGVSAGQPEFLDVVFAQGVNGVSFPDPNVFSFVGLTPLTMDGAGLFGVAALNPAPIPLPAAGVLLIGAVGGLAALKRPRRGERARS